MIALDMHIEAIFFVYFTIIKSKDKSMLNIHKKILCKLFEETNSMEIVDRQGQTVKRGNSKEVTLLKNMVICIL